MIWKLEKRDLDLSEKALVIGVLNCTPDSFSDGGKHLKLEAALAQAEQMQQEGAAIIDIGGESTRPGAAAVSLEKESARVIPVIKALREKYSSQELLISIDTQKAEVAENALQCGADIVNDVGGFTQPEMIELAGKSQAGLIAMHMQGKPETMQKSPQYENVIDELKSFFNDRLEALEKAGVTKERLVFDPGIGFGKTLEHNLTILRRLSELEVESRPILLGVSRKSFIAQLLNDQDMKLRDAPTIALSSYAREQGVKLFRVHDVAANEQALRMTEAILGVD